MNKGFFAFVFALLNLMAQNSFAQVEIHSVVVDPLTDKIKMYWKNDERKRYGSIGRLKSDLEEKGKKLVFATNGGMYLKDGSPQGLFIQNQNQITALNKKHSSYGNFYLQPNGVFYLTPSGGVVVSTSEFKSDSSICYATQSGPMLVINGEMHPAFNKESKSTYVRNGVGVLPNGSLIFAISSQPVNFYTFAQFFIEKGCNNALYLDGFVSRMYAPSIHRNDLDGNFGVLIGAESKD